MRWDSPNVGVPTGIDDFPKIATVDVCADIGKGEPIPEKNTKFEDDGGDEALHFQDNKLFH